MSSAVENQHWLLGRPAEFVDIPLDLISWVQPWTSSWISSGVTSLRDHDSSQRGFGGATRSSPCPALEAERGASLDLKTFLKKGMVGRGEGRLGGGPGVMLDAGKGREREGERRQVWRAQCLIGTRDRCSSRTPMQGQTNRLVRSDGRSRMQRCSQAVHLSSSRTADVQ